MQYVNVDNVQQFIYFVQLRIAIILTIRPKHMQQCEILNSLMVIRVIKKKKGSDESE